MNHKFSVLVCDDEKLVAKSIVKNIEKINPAFEVVGVAHDGEQAFDLVENLLPDAVFTDIKMPVMDGLALIGLLSLHYPFIKKVIVSGYNDFEYVKNALVEHASDYLLKPINPDEMHKVLKKLQSEIVAEHKAFLKETAHSSPDEIVFQVRTYFIQNFSSQIDLSLVAESLGFSPSYLTKVFKEQLNITPYRYLNKLRIDVAKKLLRNTALPIKTIAENVGFGDQFHFSKNFKLLNGLSPAQYRNNAKNAEG